MIVNNAKSVPFCKNLFNAAYKKMPINNAKASAIKQFLFFVMNWKITTYVPK